jgi:isocitrate lyase
MVLRTSRPIISSNGFGFLTQPTIRRNNMATREQQISALQKDWETNPRWKGIQRTYTAEDVVRLRGSLQAEHTLARRGAEKLWDLINNEPYVNALGALTGNQAMQQVKAGLKAIYLSGWQVAGDANLAGEMYPDQSLYPANSVPSVVRRINNTFQRADQIQWSEGKDDIDYFAPIVADAEAGFGGVLNAFELMKAMIEAGAAGVHFEDQLASVKKCGHMGGKVLVPSREAVEKLAAARLAADVMGVPTLVVARTDAEAADHRRRPERPAVLHGRTHRRRLLPRACGPGPGGLARPGLRPVRRPRLVRDRQAGPGLRQGLCRGDPRPVPGQAAGLQLLALVQLEEEPG